MKDKITLAEKMAEFAIRRRKLTTLSGKELTTKYEAVTAYIEVVASTGGREISMDKLADVASISGIGNKLLVAQMLKEDGFVITDSKNMHHRKEMVVVW